MRKPTWAVVAFSGGIDLLIGGPIYGFIGQLVGYPQVWPIGLGVAVLGAVFMAVGGFGLWGRRKGPGRSPQRGIESAE